MCYQIYRGMMEIEEMRSGQPNVKAKDIAFHQALHDPDTRAEYIRRKSQSNFGYRGQSFLTIHSIDLQVLQWWTEEFVRTITQSLQRMPYGMRYLARETLNAVKVLPVALLRMSATHGSLG